jgi:hypothetical protein
MLKVQNRVPGVGVGVGLLGSEAPMREQTKLFDVKSSLNLTYATETAWQGTITPTFTAGSVRSRPTSTVANGMKRRTATKPR